MVRTNSQRQLPLLGRRHGGSLFSRIGCLLQRRGSLGESLILGSDQLIRPLNGGSVLVLLGHILDALEPGYATVMFALLARNPVVPSGTTSNGLIRFALGLFLQALGMSLAALAVSSFFSTTALAATSFFSAATLAASV